MNRPVGIAVAIGIVVLIALGAVASRIGTAPTNEPAPGPLGGSGLAATPGGTMRGSERSAFPTTESGKRGFTSASTVATRSAPVPAAADGAGAAPAPTADQGATRVGDSSATITPISPTTKPIPLGSNRASSTVTTGTPTPNRPRRDPSARANAQANARMNAAARLQQAEAQSIGRLGTMGSGEGAPAAGDSGAPGTNAGDDGIGMPADMREQLLQQLLSGAGNNGSSSSGSSGGSGSGMGSGSGSGSGTGSGSGSGSSDGPTQSTGSGGGGGGGGGAAPETPAGGATGPTTTDTTGALSASVRWVPIETPAGCAGTTGVRLADLYVRVNTGAPVTAVESAGSGAVRVSGGAFYESPSGTDGPPTSTDSCDAVDSFLDLGGQSFIRLTSGSPFQSGPNGALSATWVVINGVVPTQSPARFGDSQYYLRVARIAAPTGAGVAGQMIVAFAETTTTPIAELNVTVPNCIECWDTGAAPPPPPPPDDGGGTPPDDGGGTPPDDGGGTPPDDGGGTPPDDGAGTPPADGGGTPPDDGGGTPPDDGGETPPDETEDPDTFDLVWLPIANSCTDPALTPDSVSAFKTYDLFIRMGKPHEIFAVDSGDASTGLTFSGQVFQFPDEGSNAPPSKGNLQYFPCLAFDSFFDANGFQPGFFVQPDAALWTSPIRAVWFSPVGTKVRGTPNAGFGGTLYYFRMMRLTITPGASVGGQVRVGGRHFDGVLAIDLDLPVPPLP